MDPFFNNIDIYDILLNKAYIGNDNINKSILDKLLNDDITLKYAISDINNMFCD